MTAGLRLQLHAPDAVDAGFPRPYRPAGGAGTDHVFKILVTGPFAAGKTSLIQSVSQSPVVSTDVATSGDESTVKMLTTVALDFGTFRIEGGGEGPDEPAEGVQLLLFGTPGQERFWFMTDVLKGDVDVTVFVVDAEAEHTHVEAGAAMRALLKDLRVPLVVAVNRCDDADPRRARPLTRRPVVRARRPVPADRPREWSRRRDRGTADASRVDGAAGGGLALRRTAAGGCAVTFAAPTPDLLRFAVAWPLPPWTSVGPVTRPLPPPPRDAVPSPGPAVWLPFDPPPVVDLIVGREVTDAFELIWPTGEIDEQFLGGPLSDMPQPGARSHGRATETWPDNGQVPDDVVLAIQRTIAAIGSDPAAIEAPPPVAAPARPGDRCRAAAISISTDDGLDRGAVAAGADRRTTFGAQAADQRVAASLSQPWRRAAKNWTSSEPHSSARTPAVLGTRWFSTAPSSRSKQLPAAPALGSVAP